MPDFKTLIASRRRAMGLAATAGAALATGSARATTGNTAKIPLRFDDPVWNREAAARLQADTNGSQVYGHCSGVVCGVRPGEAVRPLVCFEVFSTIRVLRQADGNYQRMTKGNGALYRPRHRRDPRGLAQSLYQ